MKIKKKMWITLTIIAVVAFGAFIFLQQPQFGRTPTGARLERVRQSPNYRDGKFQNIHPTPQVTFEKGIVSSLIHHLFSKNENRRPKQEIPTRKTDLHRLDKSKDVLVWFGHSSYFIQIDGKRILVDPVFSNAASPVPFFNRAFKGTNIYTAEDIPETDYLIISHDHWDHLDYPTAIALRGKIRKVICPLGAGEHFERWGFRAEDIVELDWYEEVNLDTDFKLFCLPTRHFAGRGIKPYQSLWASFLLQTSGFKIYIGGDSGYDTHFAEIGDRFDGVDLAILENGQYNKDWKYIHMMPEEVIRAAKDLKATTLLTVHHSKFALSDHSWTEPMERIMQLHQGESFQLLSPMIGEETAIQT